MPEINLPTKTVQDEIKSNTEYLKNNGAGKISDLATIRETQWKGTGWTVLSGSLDNTNNILTVPSDTETTDILQTLGGTVRSIYGTSSHFAQSFTANNAKFLTAISLKLGKTGAPSGNLDVTIEQFTGNDMNNANTVLSTTVNIPSELLPTGGAFSEYKIKLNTPVKLVNGGIYFIVVKPSDTATNASNCFTLEYANSNQYSSGLEWYKSGSIWYSSTARDFWFKIHSSNFTSLGGVAVGEITNSIGLKDLLFATYKPTGTNVIIDVLDSNDMVIKAGVTSGVDLSDITLGQAIKVRATITRNSSSDLIPTLSNVALSYTTFRSGIGLSGYTPIIKNAQYIINGKLKIVDVKGSGFVKYLNHSVGGQSANGVLRIWVDGYLIIESNQYYYSSNGEAGFNKIVTNGSEGPSVELTTGLPYSNLTSQQKKIVFSLPSELFFDNSLVIEIECVSNAGGAYSNRIDYSLGVR